MVKSHNMADNYGVMAFTILKIMVFKNSLESYL